MTQPTRPTDRDLVAAALHVAADAIRLGQLPVPNYIILHAAAMPYEQFMTLADRINVTIELVQNLTGHLLYARIELPFGADILSDAVTAMFQATCSEVTGVRRRDIETHNTECIGSVPVDDPCADGCSDPAMHAEGGHDI